MFSKLNKKHFFLFLKCSLVDIQNKLAKMQQAQLKNKPNVGKKNLEMNAVKIVKNSVKLKKYQNCCFLKQNKNN